MLEALTSAFDQRLDPASRAPLAVGFSGGSDSLAVLLTAMAWVGRAGRRVVALTVDHGLSAASCTWTREAGRTAERLGVEWRALAWTGAKPAAGLPAAARQARHRLLAEAARELGARVVLLGHTRDDVAEADWMRRDTPGLGRLRAWSPSPAWPEGRGVWLLRPLLGVRRGDLRAWLAGQGLGWLEDPANADPRFARARARLALADCGSDELGFDELDGETPPPCGQGRIGVTPDGRIRLSRADLLDAEPNAARRRLSAAALSASGGVRPPRGASLDRLLAAAAAGRAATATLAGARIGLAGEVVEFGREPGERARRSRGPPPAPQALEPGRPIVVDGRFEVVARAPGLAVRLLGGAIGRLEGEDAGLRRLPPWARATLPALVEADGRVRLPAPFGHAPAEARALVGERLAGALGLVTCEAELGAGPPGAWRPAQAPPM